MQKKIIHIGLADKFLPPLIDFIQSKFSREHNTFYLYGDESKYGYLRDKGVFFLGKRKNNVSYLKLLLEMYSADKIILHSLFSSKVIKILFYNPWLLKKCYWLMWGGDLYETHEKKGLSRYYKNYVIKNMGYLVTYLPGDVEYAKERYGAKGKYIKNLGYLSNIFSLICSTDRKSNETINILVGNSADPANEHIEALAKLEKFKDFNIKIYAPLSYGNKIYAASVAEYGLSIFGDKFEAITEFMEFEEYISFLENIDIAIFNHKRQQAMGNTISLLGMGKVVYLRKDTSQAEFFENIDVKVYDLEYFNIKVFYENNNKIIIRNFFSIEKLEGQWSGMLNA